MKISWLINCHPNFSRPVPPQAGLQSSFHAKRDKLGDGKEQKASARVSVNLPFWSGRQLIA